MSAFPPNLAAPQQGGDPSSPPAPSPNSSPLAALANQGGSVQGGSSSGSLLQMILSVLSGMGIAHAMDTIPKFLSSFHPKQPKGDKGGQPPPQGAQANPQAQQAQMAQLLQALAQRGNG